MNARRVAVTLATALAIGSGCGPSAPPPAAPPAKPRAPALHVGPVTDYVPAAGLRWMVVGRPRELARHPSLAPAIDLLLPAERLKVFENGSGIALREIDSGLVAGFDYATLYMVTPSDAALVERKFRDRLVTEPLEARPHPDIVRVTGLIGATPETLVRLDQRLVAVSVGSATPARVVEAFAQRKLRKSPTSLAGSALSTLPADLHQAPLRFYAPGPFSGEWTEGARGLLAAALAVGASARPLAGGRIEIRVVVSGDWANSATEGTSALLAAWDELAQSGLGKLLGLNEPASPPRPELGEGVLGLRVELDAMTLARGLRAAVIADVWEILDLPPPR